MKNKILFVFLLFLFSCNQKPFYEEFNTVKNRAWKENEKAEFKIMVKDTTTLYNFIINLRTTIDYKYSNLFLKVELIDPNRIQQESIFSIQLTNENGWLGKKSGSLVTTSYMPWARQKFKVPGIYTFRIEQMMQDSVLYEVTDVGLGIYEFLEE